MIVLRYRSYTFTTINVLDVIEIFFHMFYNGTLTGICNDACRCWLWYQCRWYVCINCKCVMNETFRFVREDAIWYNLVSKRKRKKKMSLLWCVFIRMKILFHLFTNLLLRDKVSSFSKQKFFLNYIVFIRCGS